MAKLKVKLSANEALIPVTRGSGNVFADLELPEAGELQLKAELTRQLGLRVKFFGLNQTEAASRLGLRQPDVSKLMAGRFTGFSTDRLIGLLNAVEIDVEIVLRPRGERVKNRGIVRVLTEAV
jgi:predicted XRE-type DNA-binding protein